MRARRPPICGVERDDKEEQEDEEEQSPSPPRGWRWRCSPVRRNNLSQGLRLDREHSAGRLAWQEEQRQLESTDKGGGGGGASSPPLSPSLLPSPSSPPGDEYTDACLNHWCLAAKMNSFRGV